MDLSQPPSFEVSADPSREAGTPSQRGSSQSLRQRVAVRAADFLSRHAADGVRIAHLSKVAGVSERTLRNAFHQEHGLSPKQFEIRERLMRARSALCAVRDPRTTVTSIALEFGFFELGRFAKAYKQIFGELPSQTIKAHHATLGRRLLAEEL